MERIDHNDFSSLQNRNLLIALGGVSRGSGAQFPIPVSK